MESENTTGPEPATLSGVVFEDPDPKLIYLNAVRLDQHLYNAGQRGALKVRELLEEMDWLSFEQSYRPGGRSPYAPRAMMGLILYGIMQGVSSLRQLERLARTDLGCMWISGGILPDHSVIGRFIQRHEVRLSGEFFEKLTARVLQVTGTGAGTVAGDGSIIEAAASRFQEIKAEALAELIVKQREKMAASEQEAGEEKRWETEKARHDLNRLLEAQQVLEERQQQRQARGKKGEVTINRQEPEAVIQPQKDKKRFLASYKPSVLVNELRIIIGQAVDPSSETQVVTSLLDQAQQQGVIETALFDAGYFNQQVIDATEERGIELLCPEGRSQGKDWHKQSGKYYPKSHFQYDPEQDHYRCPQGEILTCQSRYKGNAASPAYRLYASEACGRYSHKDQCTRSAKGRRIKRYASDGAKDALRQKMQQPAAREHYVKRQGMVEPVFSHLRYQQGLNRFRRKGLAGVRVEFSLHALAYNLSRAVALFSSSTGRYLVFFRILTRLRRIPRVTRSLFNKIHLAPIPRFLEGMGAS